MATLTTDPTNDVFNAPSPRVNMPRRYGTVAVHYIREVLYSDDDRDLRMIKWFSDIQMAWMWVRQRLNTVHRDEWAMNPFLTCVYDMDRQWNVGAGEDGQTFAENLDTFIYDGEYRAYYKPDVKYEDIPEAEREQRF
jgi:hypothetical protein